MDVLLLHCQPHSPPRLLAGLLSCLAALAAAHPAQLLPFTQSGLAAAAALADTLKAGEVRAALCGAVAGLCTGATAPSQEADTLYTVIFPGWAGQARDPPTRAANLHAVAALTPFLSDGLVRERAAAHIPALIALYKKSGTSAQVDPSNLYFTETAVVQVSVCLTTLLSRLNRADSLLPPGSLEQLLPALAAQSSALPGSQQQLEALACYSTLLPCAPEQVGQEI